MATRTMATTICTGVIVAVVVPFVLGTVDEFYRWVSGCLVLAAAHEPVALVTHQS